MLKIMELDFEIGYWLGKYHKVAGAIFRLSRKASKKKRERLDVDDDVQAYCSDKQISDSDMVSMVYVNEVEPPTTI